MKQTLPYRLSLRTVAILLITGLLLPSGLQAKELIAYCMAPTTVPVPMDNSHSCCPETGDADETRTCNGLDACSCHIDPAPPIEDNRVAPAPQDLSLSVPVQAITFLTIESPAVRVTALRSEFGSPPIWLLNRALLN